MNPHKSSPLLLGLKHVKRPKPLQCIMIMIMMMMVKSTREGFSTDDQDIDNKIVSFSLLLRKVEMLCHI
jgi:hypothetical protein